MALYDLRSRQPQTLSDSVTTVGGSFSSDLHASSSSQFSLQLCIVSLSQPGLIKTKFSVLCHTLQSDLGPAVSKAKLSMNKHLPADA